VTEDGTARRERRRGEARQRVDALGRRIAELAKRRREIGTQLGEVRASGVREARPVLKAPAAVVEASARRAGREQVDVDRQTAGRRRGHSPD
jgi:hypothetical protein